MPELLVIADDLTGAMDTGATFAQHGLTTLVLLGASPGAMPAADVLVVSTESRHIPQEQAVNAVRAAMRQAGAEPCAWIYKKIDSTLRGHPGAELAAVMDAMRIEQALVTPAFPAQGRVVRDGRVFVCGVALEETAFAADVKTGDLMALFGRWTGERNAQLVVLAEVRRGADGVRERVTEEGPRVFVADAETEDDLRTLARAAVRGGMRLLCGSAGLAGALADELTFQVRVDPPQLPEPKVGPVLVVAGSQNAVTARQVEHAARQDITVLRAPAEFGQSEHLEAANKLVERATNILAAGRDVIVTTAGLEPSSLGPQVIAMRLGQMTGGVLARVAVGGLVLTGGDIASAVCRALGGGVLWLQGEVCPGIARGRLVDGAYAGLRLVTKAGGFGAEDALVASMRALSSRGVTA
jgi:D-threonate/D-erythronate kinase